MFSSYSPLCILQNATVLHTACKKKVYIYNVYVHIQRKSHRFGIKKTEQNKA